MASNLWVWNSRGKEFDVKDQRLRDPIKRGIDLHKSNDIYVEEFGLI
jgi:hypothetical protein